MTARQEPLFGLGATIDHPSRIDTATLQRRSVVVHDPEGDEFCVA